MKLLFLSNVYLLISSVFSTCCIGVLSGIFTEVKTVELIIFTCDKIGSPTLKMSVNLYCWFNPCCVGFLPSKFLIW